MWSTLRHYPAWNGAEGALSVIPWIMLGSVIAVVLAIRGSRLKPFLGVFERLFYVSSITWGLKVKQSAASTATVHLDQDGNTTTFHVHGGGLVISRMVNEFGIAKKVAAAIQEAFATHPAS